MTRPAEQTQALIEKIQSLPRERIEEVEDFVDFQVISVEKWPKTFSLRREDMYGDDGR